MASENQLVRATVAVLASFYFAFFVIWQVVKGTGKAASYVYSKQVVRLWLQKSSALLLGTIAYNVFALFIVEPVLKRLFPPLTPWEQVRGFFGAASRVTHSQLMPYVGTGLWILGNAFLFAWMNRNLQEAKAHATRE